MSDTPTRATGIEVTGLVKSFRRTRAVDHVSFHVPRGKVTGLVGPNGAGKTTTMRMMVGLVHPDGGSTTVDGVNYASFAQPLRAVGALLGSPGAQPAMQICRHLRALAASNGIDERRADEIVRFVGLEAAAKKRVRQLSLGMAQRLCLAEALVGEPDYLILDEPFTGLDVDGIRWLRSVILELVDRGVGVLLSNHHMAEMEVLSDDLVVLGRGKVLVSGPVDEILAGAPPSRLQVRTSDPRALSRELRVRNITSSVNTDGVTVIAGGQLAEVRARMNALGIADEDIECLPPTLEDIFVEITREVGQFSAMAGSEVVEHV